jgi:Glycosyltransferase family 10 (fucosyltransferase) C-term
LKKQIIKISTPFNSAKIRSQINPSLLAEYSFEIDNDCTICDYWIVWGDLPECQERTSVRCPQSNILYMTDEAYVEKKFDQRFLDQFAGIVTCRKDVSHHNLIQTHEINIWQLDYSFEEIEKLSEVEKKRSISVVCSDKVFLPGHKKRYAFVNKLIGHFKDRLDAFGTGFVPVKDKWDALAPYKYSIAIENSALPDYFTEKIAECYLANTYPVYFGDPNIHNFFDRNSLLVIDIDDFSGSIRSIENLLESNVWEKSNDLLIQQRNIYLSRYHFFPALINVLNIIKSPSVSNTKTKIKSLRSFQKKKLIEKVYIAAKKHFKI